MSFRKRNEQYAYKDICKVEEPVRTIAKFAHKAPRKRVIITLDNAMLTAWKHLLTNF